jgi:cell division protein FtsZ
MNVNSQPAGQGPSQKNIVIKVFGVGGAGVVVVERLIGHGLCPATAAVLNTDAQTLAASSAAEKLHLETSLLRGLGTGGDPDRGRAVAEEQLPKLKLMCEGADVVFIVAGLGGGAGTGISPVLARAARQAGALALGFVTTPFDCEGSRRQRLAQLGLAALKAAADGVICLPNQKVFKLIDENTSVLETFKITNDLLAEGVRGVWRLLVQPGLIPIHFTDLCALLRDRHAENFFAVVEAMGPARSREVVEKLLAHPMLEGGQILTESGAVLVSLTGGPDLTMAEVNRVMEQINRHCEHAQVMMGAAIDENFRERITLTLIAARKEPEEPKEESRSSSDGEQLDAQLRSATTRPASRFVPPAPALPQEKMEQMLARQGRGAPRKSAGKNASKLRQTQLALEIVSKGRFDQSEPTIHKGEDLDIPTYIRRGVALN